MGILKYKYNFLREWMAATDKSMKDVKEAVGNSSNNNIHDWLGDGPAQKRQQERGEEIRPVAMNVESIVKICNAFKVPIESFFVEEGSRELLGTVQKPAESVNLITEQVQMLKERIADKDEVISSLRTAVNALKSENEALRRSLVKEKNEEWTGAGFAQT
jgi:hypothetical protein